MTNYRYTYKVTYKYISSARIEIIMNDNMIPTFDDALKLAIKCHKNQKRWNGDNYIIHPIAVAETLTGNAKIVAILHDVIEDTDMTIKKLKALGYPEDITRSLSILTHNPNVSYLQYILLIKYNKIAIKVKIKDIEHNLSDLKDGCRRDKYQLALQILKIDYLDY